jgi:hypothetical protein
MESPSGDGARYPETPEHTMSSLTEAPGPKAVLVDVQLPGVTDAEQRASLMELKRLCKTLGFEVVGEVTQKRQGLGAATLLGEGKLVELATWTGGTGVVSKGPCPFCLTIAAPPGVEGRLAVGRTAPHSGRTLIPSRTLPRIVSPNIGWAGGKGSVGREGPVLRQNSVRPASA